MKWHAHNTHRPNNQHACMNLGIPRREHDVHRDIVVNEGYHLLERSLPNECSQNDSTCARSFQPHPGGEVHQKRNKLQAIDDSLTFLSFLPSCFPFKAILDKNYAVASAALLAAIQLFAVNSESIKKLSGDVTAAMSNHKSTATVLFHAQILLHEIKKSDRNSYVKVRQGGRVVPPLTLDRRSSLSKCVKRQDRIRIICRQSS